MMRALAAALLVAACLAPPAAAHPTLYPDVNATDCLAAKPAFRSYHIHVLFWGNVDYHAQGAMELQRAFMEKFDLIGSKNCTGFTHQGRLCAFAVDWVPTAPFVTAQFAFFVPVEDYATTVPWIMQNRGVYDVLVHPNSGCSVPDHGDWAVWGGQPWEIDMKYFGQFDRKGGRKGRH